jgi:5-methylcytosine-specific restriction endonuclease McrA
MIHQVHLPHLTQHRLTDVVRLQMRLLHYASSTPTPNESGCASYLDHHARLHGRGMQIAHWVWRAPKRRRPLEQFARGPATAKQAWCRQLAREALRFLHRPHGFLTTSINRNVPAWQRHGAEFLRRFYEALNTQSGLPDYLYTAADASAFRRQDFLSAFQNENPALYVCPICDESDYSTTAEGSIKTDIEHYLPKSRYPHLACHPFNLLPICGRCNALKGSTDPLKGRSQNRRSLEDILLPYREPGLGSRTYLQVRLSLPYSATQLGQLRPRETTALRQRIQAFGSVYKIPNRWQEQVDKIGERLFRRLRQSLQDRDISSGDHFPQTILTVLMQRLYFFSEQDQGKEPFAFAMTWWLAALITHEVEPAVQNPAHPAPQTSALLQEVAAWTERHGIRSSRESGQHSEGLEDTERLLRLVREG